MADFGRNNINLLFLLWNLKACWKPFTMLAEPDSARLDHDRLASSQPCFLGAHSSSTNNHIYTIKENNKCRGKFHKRVKKCRCRPYFASCSLAKTFEAKNWLVLLQQWFLLVILPRGIFILCTLPSFLLIHYIFYFINNKDSFIDLKLLSNIQNYAAIEHV